MLLDPQEIIAALNELADALDADEVHARINVVGGMAIAITRTDRGLTHDVDASLYPAPEILEHARRIAERRGWPDTWLNNDVRMHCSDYDHLAVWTTIIERETVVVQVAPADLLLAMKLKAGRGSRDAGDIDWLLDQCEITSASAAATVFDTYYPQDEISPRARAQLSARFGANPGD